MGSNREKYEYCYRNIGKTLLFVCTNIISLTVNREKEENRERKGPVMEKTFYNRSTNGAAFCAL